MAGTWIADVQKSFLDTTAWDDGLAPAGTTTRTFNATHVGNCLLDAMGTWSGGAFNITGYTGTLTQSSGVNITTGAFSQTAGTLTLSSGATFTTTTHSVTGGTFNQGGVLTTTSFGCTSAGIFVGSSATITSTGGVSFSGTAQITATSGTWNIGSWTQSGATTTFTANGGILNLTGAGVVITDTRSTFNKWTINAAGAVTISASTTVPLGASPTTTCAGANLTMSGTVSWSGSWVHTGSITTSNGSTMTGTSTPTLTLNLSLTITNVTTITNAIGTITFNGTANTSITDTSDLLSGTTYALNKTGAGTLTIAASTNARFGLNPTITMGSGTVTITGIFTWQGAAVFTTTGTTTATGTLTGTSTPTLQFTQSLTCSAATITNTIGTVTFAGTSTSTYTDTGDKLVNSRFVVSKTGSGGFTIAASTNCRMNANPTLGVTGGTGTFTVTGTWTYSGNATVFMTGTFTGTVTATSTPTLTISRSLTTSGATITNPIGTVTFTLEQATTTYTDTTAALTATTFIVSASGTANNFTVAASTVCAMGANPSSITAKTAGGFAVQATGTVTFSGTWTHDGGFNISGVITGTLTPKISMTGSLTASTATITNPIGTVTFTGGTAITYTDTGDMLVGTTFVFNKTNNITIAAGTNCRIGNNPTTHIDAPAGNNCLTVQGTLIITGTTWTNTGNIQVSATGTISAASLTTINQDRGIVVTAGGVFPNGIAVNWTDSTVSGVGVTFTAAGINFATCTINQPNLGSTWTVSASTTLPLGNNPSVIINGSVNFSITGTVSGTGLFSMDGNIAVNAGGTISGFSSQTINGNLNINATGTYPTISILVNGSLNSTITGTTTVFGTVTFQKTGASAISVSANTTVPLGNNPILQTGSGGLTSLDGTFTGAGVITANADFNMTAGATISGFTGITSTDGGFTFAAGVTIPALNITMIPVTANRNFSTGGNTFGAWKRVGSGTGTVTFTSATGGTFTSIQDNDALVAHTIAFKEGATFTAGSFLFAGAAGKLLSLVSKTPGSQWTLHTTGGAVSASYVQVTDSIVDASPRWTANIGSVEGGNNQNWHFADQDLAVGRLNDRLLKIFSKHELATGADLEKVVYVGGSAKRMIVWMRVKSAVAAPVTTLQAFDVVPEPANPSAPAVGDKVQRGSDIVENGDGLQRIVLPTVSDPAVVSDTMDFHLTLAGAAAAADVEVWLELMRDPEAP